MPPVVTLILQVPERELSESQRLLPREGSTMVDKRSGMWTVEGIRGTAHRWALCKSSILSVFFLPPSLTSPPFLFFPLSFYKNRISIGIWDCCALAFAILLPQYLFFFLPQYLECWDYWLKSHSWPQPFSCGFSGPWCPSIESQTLMS